MWNVYGAAFKSREKKRKIGINVIIRQLRAYPSPNPTAVKGEG